MRDAIHATLTRKKTQTNFDFIDIARAAAGQMVMTGSPGSRGQETAGLGPGLDPDGTS